MSSVALAEIEFPNNDKVLLGNKLLVLMCKCKDVGHRCFKLEHTCYTNGFVSLTKKMQIKRNSHR